MTVICTVSNRGTRAAREVAQLYVHQRVSSITRPIRELQGFQAVQLAPGQSRTLRFTLDRQRLAAIQPDLRFATEPGVYDVVVAPNAAAGEMVPIEVRG